MDRSRISTPYGDRSTSYQSEPFTPLISASTRSGTFTSRRGRRSTARTGSSTTRTRPSTARASTARPSTAYSTTGRSRSRAPSVIGGGESQQIICALSEARGTPPTVGLAFVNISTGEAVLSQLCDNQFYARALNKLQVFEPTEILMVSTSGPPNQKSKMFQVVESNIIGARIITVDRRYWSESAGLEFIQQLAFEEDIEAIKVAIGGNFFATCCFAAVLKHINLSRSLTFAFHSLRIKYQPSEGSMMIDLSTIQSLELIQNIRQPKSKECLFGVLNETLTPMGSYLLRSCILQPSTQPDLLNERYEAVEELSSKEDMFFQVRQALKPFQNTEKLLSRLIIVPTQNDIRFAEQSINNVLMLKSFILLIEPLFESLAGARSHLLVSTRENFQSMKIRCAIDLINEVINEDVTYCKTPLNLRNQRTYAVKSGVSGLLDVARQTYKEATEDVHQHIEEISQLCEFKLETKYDNSRRYWLRLSEREVDGGVIPDILINRYRNKGFIECQTLALMKLNQRIEDSHQETVLMSDKTIQDLLKNIRAEIPILFKVCEGIALLDMLASFAQLVTTQEYIRPEITESLAISAGRHPIRELVHPEKFIPNDIYATKQTRFQIITGCNMSGKSTYIRAIALMSVMAQIGSFVPAQYASLPIIHQLFARVSTDDNIEANISTFTSEMREMSYILRNIDDNSLVIIDELGRGTSTRDGIAIALSIAEALVESKALIWFATHFRELEAQIMSERPGVVNLHLTVDTSKDHSIKMLYKIGNGFEQEEHYGLTMARVVDIPPDVLEVAERVSRTINARMAAQKSSSGAFALTRRRKLVLGLRETLQQALDSPMDGSALVDWLAKLQEEFVRRMEQIEGSVTEESMDMDGESVGSWSVSELMSE